MDVFSLLYSSPRPKGEKTIDVNLEDLEQFFNTMDPSPFHEKDLDQDLEEFIVSWATEYSLHDPLRLVVYLQNRPPDIDAQSVIEQAVRNYFAYKTGLNQREFKQLLREGRLSLLIGLLFLTLCLGGGQMASRLDIPGANIMETSLTIAGLGSDVASDGRFPLWMVAIAPGGQGLSQTQRYPSRSQIFRCTRRGEQISCRFRRMKTRVAVV
jgi:hypothetical protein